MTEIGNRYGRLVVKKEFLKNKRKFVEALCDCGNVKEIRLSHLVSGKIQSCKCLHKEIIRAVSLTHGLRKHPLYIVWSHFKQRCINKNSVSYSDYGGRGITVCKEWLEDFQTFYLWAIENGWRKDLQIDREDNNLGYSPDNCRFVSRSLNCRNRRNNVFVKFNGITKTLAEWSDDTKIEIRTLWARLFKYNWSVEKALTNPIQIQKK